jgi:hypothetical protein
MKKETIKNIINEVYPKIVNHYGARKGFEIPKVEVHKNIFARLSGNVEMEGEDSAIAEFCKDENKIFIYFPFITSKVDLIKSLLHEYRHYLQPCNAISFYYDLGYTYDNNPCELEAIAEESNWKNFIE